MSIGRQPSQANGSFTISVPPAVLDATSGSWKPSEILSVHTLLSTSSTRQLLRHLHNKHAVLVGPMVTPEEIPLGDDTTVVIAVSTVALKYPMFYGFDYAVTMDRPFARRLLEETIHTVIAVEPLSNPPLLFSLETPNDAGRLVSVPGPEDPWNMTWVGNVWTSGGVSPLAGGGHSTVPALNLLARAQVRSILLCGFSDPMPNPRFQETFEAAVRHVKYDGIPVKRLL